ncbi:hypothetical protein SUNI508_07675 [Seiridium unicorne]|uniref:NmrA-like domain-containing protein n=1 Tax=Seiridium unicorne TaxID=138068 RepID=A0ABR2UWV1_9PEZI
MSKLIAITGVTGLQGSSVAETFLKLSGWRVRGLTRNPTSKAAQALASRGVEIVKADFNDKHSLLPAFEGAAVVFSNTDFFAILMDAAQSSALPSGRDPKEHAYDVEVQQGVSIAETAASPRVIKTLERFVLSSLSDAKKWSGGKYTGLYHYDSKAEMIRIIHERFPQVAERMSFVQMGHYVTNWRAFPPMAPQKQPDGSFAIVRPFGPELALPFVVPDRDTGAFVKALVDMPAGKDLLGVSQTMTWPEWMDLWGSIHGVKTGFKQVSREEFFGAAPKVLQDELWDTYEYIREFGYDGGDPNVLTPDQLDSKILLTSMEKYIRSEDWSSVLSS